MRVVIPCAGRSSRMSYIPKHLITIKGKPLISYVIDYWKGNDLIFVLRRDMTYMWNFIPDNSAVVFQDEPKGLADAILRAEPYIGGRFIVALGDCLVQGEFEEILNNWGIGVCHTDEEELKKNYAVWTNFSGYIKYLTNKENRY